jgi:hypothetical protein
MGAKMGAYNIVQKKIGNFIIDFGELLYSISSELQRFITATLIKS